MLKLRTSSKIPMGNLNTNTHVMSDMEIYIFLSKTVAFSDSWSWELGQDNKQSQSSKPIKPISRKYVLIGFTLPFFLPVKKNFEQVKHKMHESWNLYLH